MHDSDWPYERAPSASDAPSLRVRIAVGRNPAGRLQTPEHLGEYVLVDYVSNKRRVAS